MVETIQICLSQALWDYSSFVRIMSNYRDISLEMTQVLKY